MPGVPEDVADALQADLTAQPAADLVVPWFLASVRHECAATPMAQRQGRSTSASLALAERYVLDTSGEYALLYREGSCRRCGLTARSDRGRAVIVADRPPLTGRVAR